MPKFGFSVAHSSVVDISAIAVPAGLWTLERLADDSHPVSLGLFGARRHANQGVTLVEERSRSRFCFEGAL